MNAQNIFGKVTALIATACADNHADARSEYCDWTTRRRRTIGLTDEDFAGTTIEARLGVRGPR